MLSTRLLNLGANVIEISFRKFLEIRKSLIPKCELFLKVQEKNHMEFQNCSEKFWKMCEAS